MISLDDYDRADTAIASAAEARNWTMETLAYTRGGDAGHYLRDAEWHLRMAVEQLRKAKEVLSEVAT